MHSRIVLPFVLGAALAVTSAATGAEQKKAAAPPPAHHMASPGKTDAQLIASAESAAPRAVAKDATIVAVAKDGSMRTVRKGTNGFTCMGDNPATPGPDPMCADANAWDWVMAWVEKKDPDPAKVGFMYMLAGGTDFSNVDPYATKPTAANAWVKTGPHVMVVGSKELLTHYPSSPKPDTTQPYVMWAGTPYAHLMAPVR
jgi:hypothetical protein